MSKKEDEKSAPAKKLQNEDAENPSPKAIYVALRNLVYFDQLFREDLTGNNSGNNRTHIANRVEADNAKYGTNFPTGKQIISVKKMFISLGAVFREKGNDLPGEGSCYEYKNRNSVLWLDSAIAEIRKKLNKSIKKTANSAKDVKASEPHDVWLKLYIREVMRLRSTSAVDYVGFYENMHLVGLEYFAELLEYIVDKKPIEISYIPFNGQPECVKVYPYFLKNYNQRWYLLGRKFNISSDEQSLLSTDDELSRYALDRIKPIKSGDGVAKSPAVKPLDDVAWKENDIDIEGYYKNMIGVTHTGDIKETILRFEPARYKYVETKKMLSCQQEIKPGEEYYDAERPTIRMMVMQNKELVQQILSFGCDVEVIKPDSLREDVKDIVFKMYNCYGHK